MIVKDGNKKDVLFLARDNGDTNPAKSFIQQLTSSSFLYEILLLAHASTNNLLRDGQTFHARSLTEIPGTQDELGHAHGTSLGGEQGHATPLSDATIEAIRSHYDGVKVVWTGMISEAQVQLAEAFAEKGVAVYSFWDAYHTTKDDPRLFGESVCGQNFIPRFAGYSTEVFVANDLIYKRFAKQLPPTLQPKLSTLGHPCAQQVKAIVTERQQNTTFKNQLFDTLRLDPHTPLMVYCGAYGASYVDELRIFLKAVESLEPSSFQVVLSIHPSSDGAVEKAELSEKGLFQHLQDRVKICKLNDYQYEEAEKTPTAYETLDLLSYADVIATYKSTLLGHFAQFKAGLETPPCLVYIGSDVDKIPDVKLGQACAADDGPSLQAAIADTKLASTDGAPLDPFVIMSSRLLMTRSPKPVAEQSVKPLQFTPPDRLEHKQSTNPSAARLRMR